MIASVGRFDGLPCLNQPFDNQPPVLAYDDELFQATFEASRSSSSNIKSLYLDVMAENTLSKAYKSHVRNRSRVKAIHYPTALKSIHRITDIILRKFSSAEAEADGIYRHLSHLKKEWSNMMLDPSFDDEFIPSMIGHLDITLFALGEAKDKGRNVESWKNFWILLRRTYDFAAKLLQKWSEGEDAE